MMSNLNNNIVANIATFPGRSNLLKMTIESILPQVDQLNVYLNEYGYVPDFLEHEKINAVLSKDALGDLKDNGKFYFLDKCPRNSYYFTIDDDILYPKDYVSRMVGFLKKYNHKIVVGVHGIIFNCDFRSFRQSRMSFYFGSGLDRDLIVSTLGTGTLAFKVDTLRGLSLQDFQTVGMADLWFAIFCKKENISLFCMNREESWLKNLHIDDNSTYSLWNESSKNENPQNEIIQKNKLWELNREGEYIYRCYLEDKEELLQVDSNSNNNCYVEEENKKLKQGLMKILKSKSFLLGDLFFRSIRNPLKILTMPFNIVVILLKKDK